MGSSFFIKSYLGDLVIDIKESSTKPGTELDAYTKKTTSPDWNNQLWTFVTSISEEGYYVLKNPASKLVIDVQENSTTPGTLLDAYTLKVLGTPPLQTNAPNQMWSFMPSSVPNYYFIQSNLGDLVIDVQRDSTKPGTLLDAYTKKTTSPGWNNQLWTFIDESGHQVTPPPPPVVTPPPP
jgi:Ricin-type beta-trefoil lectin domain-like